MLGGEEALAFVLVLLRVVEFVLGRLEVGAGRRPLLFDLGLHLLFKFGKANKIKFVQVTSLSSTPPSHRHIFLYSSISIHEQMVKRVCSLIFRRVDYFLLK